MFPLEQAGLRASAQLVVQAESWSSVASRVPEAGVALAALARAVMPGWQMPLVLSQMFSSVNQEAAQSVVAAVAAVEMPGCRMLPVLRRMFPSVA